MQCFVAKKIQLLDEMKGIVQELAHNTGVKFVLISKDKTHICLVINGRKIDE